MKEKGGGRKKEQEEAVEEEEEMVEEEGRKGEEVGVYLGRRSTAATVLASPSRNNGNGKAATMSAALNNKVCNFDLYRPIRAVHTGPPGYRYVDRPLPGGSVKKSTVGGRLREKLTIGGRLRKKKGRRRGKEKKKRGEERIPACAPSFPACCRRSLVACAPSPPAGRPRPRPLFLPREETERLPARGDRSRRQCSYNFCSSIMEGEQNLWRFSPEILVQDSSVKHAISLLPHVILFHGTSDQSIPSTARLVYRNC
ncbi:hypothetical protein GW17_00014786 [Ensete ventricosum]|nr:hypothetical protein GW17_00014786 [Ensete ventricosum]